MLLPCRRIHLKSHYRWLRSGRGWGCIRPLAPHSNFQYIRSGSGSSEHFLRPDTDPSCDTDGQHRLLHRQGETGGFMADFFKLKLDQRGFSELTHIFNNTLIHTQQTHQKGTGVIFKTRWLPSYLSVWLPPHRKHLGRHNKVPSSQSHTCNCRWCPFASKFPRSYRAMSHTTKPNSETHSVNLSLVLQI